MECVAAEEEPGVKSCQEAGGGKREEERREGGRRGWKEVDILHVVCVGLRG